MLEPLDPNGPAIIIETKRTKNRKELASKCEEALRQIEERKYAQKFLDEGYEDILKYGVTFFKKGCLVKKG